LYILPSCISLTRSIASDALALPVPTSAFAASTALKKRLEELVQVQRACR
jgi:hypothetical protein